MKLFKITTYITSVYGYKVYTDISDSAYIFDSTEDGAKQKHRNYLYGKYPYLKKLPTDCSQITRLLVDENIM